MPKLPKLSGFIKTIYSIQETFIFRRFFAEYYFFKLPRPALRSYRGMVRHLAELDAREFLHS